MDLASEMCGDLKAESAEVEKAGILPRAKSREQKGLKVPLRVIFVG